MAVMWCLAEIDRPMTAVFTGIGVTIDRSAKIRTTRLDVLHLRGLMPHVLVCDVDDVDVDPLELLRRIRFVLPDCTIVAYTANTDATWAATCHRAGVSCMLAKASSRAELEYGIRAALDVGCYTDSQFLTAAGIEHRGTPPVPAWARRSTIPVNESEGR